MFAQRLDFLMELTNTQASALSRACALDASHVSRLRNGSRCLPKNPAFLPAMSVYLARRVQAEYQKRVLCEAMKLGAWPVEEQSGALLIEQFLRGQPQQEDIEPILSGFTRAPRAVQERPAAQLPQPKLYYYGPAGKREAILQFFDLILKQPSPQTLLLSSEEEMSWLYDDPQFAARWSATFMRVLQAGNRVRIIHTVGRNLHELIQAVAKWVPIYMTGMIEPYYYPKLRDGVSQRTLFLAPRTAAVVSSSVAHKTDGMLNTLITDTDAVAALEKEFDVYFSLCRPLMQIMTPRSANALWQTWQTLACAQGELICVSAMPTLATMPEAVARALQARAPDSRIFALWKSSTDALNRQLAVGRYTELTAAQDAGELTLPCAEFLGAPGLCYTGSELAAHRAAARKLAADCGRFRLLVRGDLPQNLLLYGREGIGMILAKTDAPGIAFAISEPGLTNAFWDYLDRKTQQP